MADVKLCVSYCLYGARRIYLEGMLLNVYLCKKYYPGATIIVWHDNSVPAGAIELITKAGAECKIPGRPLILLGNELRMLWRFLPMDPGMGYDAVLSRDADSRVGPRETAAVNQWLDSGRLAHNMKDSGSHTARLMGGMCGFRTRFEGIHRMILRWVANRISTPSWWAPEGWDQAFLGDVIWPIVSEDCLVHGDGEPWPEGPGTWKDDNGVEHEDYHVGSQEGPRINSELGQVAPIWKYCTP